MSANSGGQPTTGSVVRRMILGSQLRRLREEAGITRAEAGYLIRGSDSKMSRLELGRVGFKERDVVDLLKHYGVTDPADHESYLSLVALTNQPGWWRNYNDLLPKWFEDYVGLEEAASLIQNYELQFIPGLLQTEQYIRAVVSRGEMDKVSQEIERRVALRLQRQKVLLNPQGPRFWAVIDESVLHRPLGGVEVLAAQIDRLLELTKLPHISVQIVPYALSGCAAEGPFTLLRFAQPELPNIAYVEYLTGALYLERQDEVETFSRAMDRLAVAALTPEQSRARLSQIRAEL
ncbi:MAG TPA: helix-turn-helix transcriptional regulator [Actinocrinis sp.]|nr:helix-turn-helix transcriptional regulator [Actinocrinis sp.]